MQECEAGRHDAEHGGWGRPGPMWRMHANAARGMQVVDTDLMSLISFIFTGPLGPLE